MIDSNLAYTAVKDVIKLLRSQRKQKITTSQFIKTIEKKYKVKLSIGSKNQLLSELRGRDGIRIVTSRNGKRYILIGNIFDQ